ncbi:MAG: PKD domain-containing protein [Bacteroidia bacterium]
MKKHFYILAIILLSLLATESKASHLVGSDITYQCTSSPSVYKVTMKIYRDCAGIPLCPGCTNAIPNGTVASCTTSSSGWSTQIVGATGACTGVNYGSFTLTAVSASSGFDILQTCTAYTTICTNCNTRTSGTFSPGIEVYTYEGNVDLSGIPTSCCNVTLGANTCCRNGALTTISPGSFQTVCTVNRCLSACNSAPTFTNDAAAIVCAGVDFVYNLGAMDPDGDSLSYAFGASLQGIGSNVTYYPPYSASYPFPYFGAPNAGAAYPAGLRIDPATGDVLFRPLGVFVSNLVIEVTQWKLVSGVRVYVGMTRRDVQFQTQFCLSNKVPRIKAYKNSIIQTSLSFSVQAGQPICLDIVAEDQFDLITSPPINADTTDMKWNNPGLYIPVMANATFFRNYVLSQRPMVGPKADSFKFCWTPPIGAIRAEPYLLTVTGSDRFCPVKAFATRGITIKVEAPKTLTIDSTTKRIYCNNRITSTNLNYSTSLINMQTGNVFTVQLSDSSGSFANATAIGTTTATDTVGFIPIAIPTGLFVNSNYKIRVNCSSDTVNKGTPFAISFVTGFSTPVITNNRDSFCKGLISTFKVTPNTAGLTFKWLKNNAIIANQTKDSLLVDSAYTYRALVSNTGCTDTSNAKYLTVYPKPIAGFTTNNISQCVNGNNFIFTDTSKIASGSTSRLWTLNNADTSTSIITNKTFINAGNLPVKLVSISNYNCKDSIIKTMYVNPKPIMGFTINNTAQCLNGNSFRFTDTTNIASGLLITRTWNFGGGANDVSTVSNPTKVYTVPNIYAVKLVVGSNFGCKDSIIKPISVNPKPLVGFTVNSALQCLNNNNFMFADTTSISFGTFTRKWNFGGGTSDTSIVTNPTKTYPAVGNYTVKLVATSSNNCKDSMLKNVTISASTTANFNINNASQCLTGNNFTFTNSSANSTSQTWTFGDASNSTTLNPTKTYTTDGSYNVKLVAKNAANCNDSITKNVTVNPQPVAAFSINNASQCLNGNNFAFTDNSTITTGTLSRVWRFGINDSSTNVSVNKTYLNTGTFSIQLISKSSNNCTDSITKTVTVLPKITAGNILGNANPKTSTTPYSYSVLSQPNTTYNWTANKGTIQSGQGTNAVSVLWSSIGSGSLTAKITNSIGCNDSTVLPINITVGINNLSLDNDLNVYPNPTKSSITITNKINLVGKKYIITNLIGQTVITGKLNLDETIVNLETLQSGVYLLSIDGMNKQSIKVIKE